MGKDGEIEHDTIAPVLRTLKCSCTKPEVIKKESMPVSGQI